MAISLPVMTSPAMASKVERLAAMVDDKTLISSLIREGSSRINLIEFKDARADIWQHFRLVQLDGETVAYAVCVRCLKPVSYKAREGTGGLHRHPCSKALARQHAMIGHIPDHQMQVAKVEDLSSESSHSPSPPPDTVTGSNGLDFNTSLSNMNRLLGLAQNFPMMIEGGFRFSNGSPRTDHHATTILGDRKNPCPNPFSGLRSLFERGVLLDLTLAARNGSVNMHRPVFAASSRICEFRCETLAGKEVDLKSFDINTVKSLVDYLYQGKMDESGGTEDLIDMMRISEELDLPGLKFNCAQYLYKKLSPENAIEFLSVADKFNCDELKELIPLFVAENAERVTSSSAWRETFKERSDLVAHLLNVTAQEMTGIKKVKTSH